jgi:hypothetical protein
MEAPPSAINDTLIHELQERIKELDCVHAISDVAANPKAPLDEILQNIVDRISLGFQEPESTCACLAIFNKAIKTANFKACRWKLEAGVIVDEKIAGKLEVGYLGAMLDEDSPFLEEKKKLLQAVASRHTPKRLTSSGMTLEPLLKSKGLDRQIFQRLT